MRVRQLYVYGLFAFVAIALGLLLYVRSADKRQSPLQSQLFSVALPQWAWDVPFVDLNFPAKKTTLRQWQGRPVVINFWAPWCGPCVQEVPDLMALYGEFRTRGIDFIGIGFDTSENIRLFKQKIPMTYTLLVADFEKMNLMKVLGNTSSSLPFTVVLDAQGKVLFRYFGKIQAPALRAQLKTLESL